LKQSRFQPRWLRFLSWMLWPGAVFICLLIAPVLLAGAADPDGVKLGARCAVWTELHSPNAAWGMLWRDTVGTPQGSVSIYADRTYTLTIEGTLVRLREGFPHLHDPFTLNCVLLSIEAGEVTLRINHERVWRGVAGVGLRLTPEFTAGTGGTLLWR